MRFLLPLILLAVVVLPGCCADGPAKEYEVNLLPRMVFGPPVKANTIHEPVPTGWAMPTATNAPAYELQSVPQAVPVQKEVRMVPQVRWVPECP